MNKRLYKVMLLALCGLVGPAYLLGDYVLQWYTIDGGGETACTGGGYELSGTAGQPDASDGALTGGGYELTGGFWTPIPRGSPLIEPDAFDSEPIDEPVEPIDAEPLPAP